MLRWMIPAVLAFGSAMSVAAQAQDEVALHPQCQQIVDQLVQRPDAHEAGLKALLADDAKLLARFYDTGTGDREALPFPELYQGAVAPKRLGFTTKGREGLSNSCARIDGVLTVGDDKSKNTIERENGTELPVSVFVVASPDHRFMEIFAAGVSRAVIQETFTPFADPDSARPAGRAVFSNFELSAYFLEMPDGLFLGAVNRTDESEQLGWMTVDTGNGPRVITLICAPKCAGYATEQFPHFALGTPENAALETQDAEAPETDTDGADPEITVVLPDSSRVSASFEDLSRDANEQQIIEAVTAVAILTSDNADLGDDWQEQKSTALRVLTNLPAAPTIFNIPSPDDLLVEDADEVYTVIVTTTPRGPKRLTELVIEFDKPASNELLRNCTIKASVLFGPQGPEIPFPLQGVFSGSKLTGFSAKSIAVNEVFETSDAQSASLQNALLDNLTVKFVVPEDDPTCMPIWGDGFENVAHKLLPDADIDDFSITSAGVATFSNVRLVSTVPPMVMVGFTKAGQLNPSQQLEAPKEYPEWATPGETDQMAEALATLMHVADTKQRGASDLFLVLGSEKETARDFAEMSQVTARPDYFDRVSVAKGELGDDALPRTLQDASADLEGQIPRFFIIGRTGLPEGSDYCATVPAQMSTAAPGSVLIDFVPQGSTETTNAIPFDQLVQNGLPSAIQTASSNFPFDQCETGQNTAYSHWVFYPDNKSRRNWRRPLETIASFIFGDNQ